MQPPSKLREVLRYDRDTGHFWWLERISIRCRTNAPAGCATKGRLVISAWGRTYSAASLAWWFVHGEWPDLPLRHANGHRFDNRLANLVEGHTQEAIQPVMDRGTAKNDLAATEVRSLLKFDPQTGAFLWRDLKRKRRSGDAVHFHNGYARIKIGGRHYAAHRLAWLYVYGEWPSADIDHINGDRADNCITNLRVASPGENNANARRYANNKSGYKGVSWNRISGKFRAQIKKNGVVHFLGAYDDPAIAHRVYIEAARQMHGEFARAA